MTTDRPLQGRSALVTGASSGVGNATARKLARDGASVALAARREERLQELAETIETDHRVETRVLPTDVTDWDQVDRTVRTTVDELDGLDIVVNNAGIGPTLDIPVEETPLEQYHAVMEVNTDGMFYTARSSLPHLRESNGHIVFVGSYAGQYPYSVSPVYAASKWWARGFALSLAATAEENEIQVTIVNPSGVRTEFGRQFRDATNVERLRPDEALEPEDIADAIGYAVGQGRGQTVNELDIYHRNQFSHF